MSDAQLLDRCESCGFDGEEWNGPDTITTIEHVASFAALWAEPIQPEHRNTRPAPQVWSAAEYVDHLRETLFGMRFLIDLAVDEPGRDLGSEIEPAPAGPHRNELDFDTCVAALDEQARALAARLAELDEATWDNTVHLGGRPHSIGWAARHGLHDAWHHLTDIAAVGATLGPATGSGPAPAPMEGTVARISVSDGGVPKGSVTAAEVGRRGLVGDRQRNRRHHGRPWQALCLWSAEVIEALVAEGHPIEPGAAGENLTLSGLDWPVMHAGAMLDIGTVRCQLSAPAVPCAKNNRWFADGDSRRIGHDRHPGWSRWYASVLTPGTISTGDAATLLATNEVESPCESA